MILAYRQPAHWAGWTATRNAMLAREADSDPEWTAYPHDLTRRRKSMRLRRNQFCPIHRSRFCCGREMTPRERRPSPMGVRRIEDPLILADTGNSDPTQRCES